MNSADFEYEIRKDVRNNPIVREVDRARHRELWRWAFIGSGLVAVVLFSAWQHFQLIRYGYRLEKMRQEKVAEERVERHLRLEIETLSAPKRIYDIATRQLSLVAPSPAQSIVIERVTTAAPPGRGLVASR